MELTVGHLRALAQNYRERARTLEILADVVDSGGELEATILRSAVGAAMQPFLPTPTGQRGKGELMSRVLEACNGRWHSTASLMEALAIPNKADAAVVLSRLKTKGYLESRQRGLRNMEYRTTADGRREADLPEPPIDLSEHS